MKNKDQLIRLWVFCIVFMFVLLNVSKAQDNKYEIKFFGYPEYDDTSKVQVRFDIFNDNGKKVKFDEIKDAQISNVIIGDLGRELKNPRYFPNSFEPLKENIGGNKKRSLSDGTLNANDITVSVLVDRSGSMTQSKIDKVKEVLHNLLKQMPEGSVYYSWFNNEISSSLPMTKDQIETDVKVAEDRANAHTDLYNAMHIKLLEFDSLPIPNIANEEFYRRTNLYNRKTPQNYLIVLTDGKDESEKIKKYKTGNFRKIDENVLLAAINKNSQKENPVEIWMVGIKDIENDKFFNEAFMKEVCITSGKPDNYKIGGQDKLPDIFVEVIDDILPDYKMKIEFPKGTKFVGYPRSIRVELEMPDRKKARGSFTFVKGSKTKPEYVDPPGIHKILLNGLVIGLLFLFVVIVLIQIIVPLFRSVYFKMTYVKNYKPDSDTERLSCFWCKEEIKPGSKAVFKCEHVSHWECWKSNGHKCPNHPDMCETGKQDYFDINDPLARNETDSVVKQNKKRFTRWIVAGILGGLITWLFYRFLLPHGVFNKLVIMLVPQGIENTDIYIEKFSPLLLLGTLLGFFLSLFFLYIEEFRRVNLAIALRLFLRAIIGAVLGLVIFMAGSVVLIQMRIYLTSYADVLPWILFGPLMGYYLSIKTTLSGIHGIIGGVFSILFSFITLYLFNNFNEDYTIVLSFVLYGAGLGAAISTIRQMAEKYFLILNNAPVKNKEFPLHKWISKSADYGMFSVGKGNKCVIRMDWEKAEKVSEDVHVAIYLEKSNKDYPVIVVRDTKTKTYLNEHMLLRPEKEYLLHNGDTFKLGETTFRYEERQKN